ncbi:MAG: hypothetical protein U9P50_02235 [Patescibacteria group bacterium]|nr:hypothetical protein [Patescibacteria group bacterium]
MRLEKFESAGKEPLGEGIEKKSFINPKDERKIISETKEGAEKDTPRQLKGRYYLTKIAHLLLPENIPDIYQAGESRDGIQTVDRERISHTPGHKLLQEKRRSDEEEELARQEIIEEMGGEMNKVTNTIADIGLAFNIDENIGNYTKNEAGNVYYLETFKPWEVDLVNPKELEALFDEEELREAIDGISDQKVKEKCTQYLEKLLVLFEEEKQELPEHREASLIECSPHIEELEAMIIPFLEEEILSSLNTIKTEEEAKMSDERKTAHAAHILIFQKLKFLINETNISQEKYDKLDSKRKSLDRAIGTISRGIVDHDR